MQCSWVTCKVAEGMVLSYLQGCWRDGHQSHAFELRRSGHQSADTFQFVKSLTWEYWTRCYWSLALEGLKQARLLSVELRKLLALQVHHHVLISGRWGTIKSTNKHSTSYLKYKSLYCKNIPIQLNFWNGLLFPTHMYVSTLNQKVICRYCENKNNTVSGPVCCLIPGADTIYFCLK